MTQNNLLNSDDQPVIDESKDYFAELVGENKKFKTPQDLAKSKAYSDAHIAILEKQNEEYRQIALKNHEAATAGAKLQDLQDKLDKTLELLASREQNQNSNEDTKPAMKIEDIESLVSDKLTQHEQTKREQDNFSAVQSKLVERFGNNYKNALKEQADALGLSDADVNTMARKNPNLFFKTFDLNVKPEVENFVAPPKGSNFRPTSKEVRNWNYYQNLKKENPRAWLDKKIAIQMEKDSQALGAKFFEP